MPVFKKEDITLPPIQMDGVLDMEGAPVIGKAEGWNDHVMRWFRLKPGGHAPRHSHDWEHYNYIISGKGTLLIDGKVNEVKAGDFAVVPSNADHQFANPYDEPMDFICIVHERGAYPASDDK